MCDKIVTARLAADPKVGVMSLETAMELYIGGREPKWRRMLRALWRVKDA